MSSASTRTQGARPPAPTRCPCAASASGARSPWRGTSRGLTPGFGLTQRVAWCPRRWPRVLLLRVPGPAAARPRACRWRRWPTLVPRSSWCAPWPRVARRPARARGTRRARGTSAVRITGSAVHIGASRASRWTAEGLTRAMGVGQGPHPTDTAPQITSSAVHIGASRASRWTWPVQAVAPRAHRGTWHRAQWGVALSLGGGVRHAALRGRRRWR